RRGRAGSLHPPRPGAHARGWVDRAERDALRLRPPVFDHPFTKATRCLLELASELLLPARRLSETGSLEAAGCIGPSTALPSSVCFPFHASRCLRSRTSSRASRRGSRPSPRATRLSRLSP